MGPERRSGCARAVADGVRVVVAGGFGVGVVVNVGMGIGEAGGDGVELT